MRRVVFEISDSGPIKTIVLTLIAHTYRVCVHKDVTLACYYGKRSGSRFEIDRQNLARDRARRTHVVHLACTRATVVQRIYNYFKF